MECTRSQKLRSIKMPILSSSLSVWEIAHRWAGYDPDIFRVRLPLLVKDYARLLFDEIMEGNLFCDTLIQAKRPPDSKADPRYYIRSHLHDINMCIWGKRFKRSLMKWAEIPRYEFEEWCERYAIPLPEFWFPPGWNRHYDTPWYGPRAFWVYHIEPDEPGGVSYGFNIPKEEDEKPAPEDSSQVNPESGRPNQKARFMVQQMAMQLWKEHPQRTIAEMARDEKLLTYSGAAHYTPGALRKWLSEVAPVNIKGKRGRPRKKPDIVGN